MDFKQAIDLLALGYKVRRKTWRCGLYVLLNDHNILVMYSLATTLPTPYRPDWQDLDALNWGIYDAA